MIRLRDIKMKPKLIGLFLLIGLLPLLIVGIWSSKIAEDSLMAKSFDQLKAIQAIKKNQVQNYFTDSKDEIEMLAETVSRLGGLQTENWDAKKLEFFKKFKEQYGYYDLFLINRSNFNPASIAGFYIYRINCGRGIRNAISN